jgi:hypothetical protein
MEWMMQQLDWFAPNLPACTASFSKDILEY